MKQTYSIEQSINYCKLITKNHYENFTVASRLLPRRYRNAFYVIYAFCRWSDDLGDETESPEKALKLLNDWEKQLEEMFRRIETPKMPHSGFKKRIINRPENDRQFLDDKAFKKPEMESSQQLFHPILIALESIVRQFELPRQPFFDLLVAFRSDQQKQTFRSLTELEQYCRFSANPVGRILLFLILKTPTESQLQYSDHICTALQWTNFWQDVRRDREKMRDYLPCDIQQQYNSFQDQIKMLVKRTKEEFECGRPLLKTLNGRFRFEISLFLEGGMAVLEKIEKIKYQTDKMRPILNRNDKIRIFLRCLKNWIFNR
ncbi:MAG: squalene/phytoene synthase family protein [Planctomycetia bacterium]|nr:squalene/phytoene synthase family protein [Planctomycetia bacterium]